MQVRQEILIKGIVQGVGFRPFVYRLATRQGLCGYIRNDTTGVLIDVEGEEAALEGFVEVLQAEAPPLAVIEEISSRPRSPRGYVGFRIAASRADEKKAIFISPDIATCADCLRELADPADRRFRYPFLNCTNCGPRYTIIRSMPYDRKRTTMERFPMCPACRSEYEKPVDRRFHAQPTACPACGPSLQVLDPSGAEVPTTDPIADVAGQLRAGRIVAIKGLGGYHLACNALDREAVARLRERKNREAKPFALMVRDLHAARRLCEINGTEARLLTSPRRPIVLLRKLAGCLVAQEVAPGNRYLGLMLPYTALHHLLLQATGTPLVMTSGNLSDEPIAYKDDEALTRLGPIADTLLIHNRPIQTRCDDPVIRIFRGEELPLRRARGLAPQPLKVSPPFRRPILAVGGHLKNTFCLTRGPYAFMSHHIGDLEEYTVYQAFEDGIEHLQSLLEIEPEVVAHDLHPDYLSTRYAQDLPNVTAIGVQHHHAHIAACMAEHGLSGPVIGVAWDGTGYGTDGRVWGGEFLIAELADFRRGGHFAYLPLPGGEQAIREPWRMAAAALYRAFGPDAERLPIEFARRLEVRGGRILRQMIEREINCPLTSSAGRLFDAVAALLGLREVAEFEGQAAMELEMAAEEGVETAYPFRLTGEEPVVIETVPIIQGMVEDLQRATAIPIIAGKFHYTLSEIILHVTQRIRSQIGIDQVALSGGCFQNTLLLSKTVDALEGAGFTVFTHRRVPPNDGGLCLGQAVVANARLVSGRSDLLPEKEVNGQWISSPVR